MTLKELERGIEIKHELEMLSKAQSIMSLPYPVIADCNGNTVCRMVGFASFDKDTAEQLKNSINGVIKARIAELTKELEEL